MESRRSSAVKSRWTDMKDRKCMLPVVKWGYVEQKQTFCHSTYHLRTCQRLLFFLIFFIYGIYSILIRTGSGCVFVYPKQSNGLSPIWLIIFGVGRFFNVVHLSKLFICIKNIIQSPPRSLITYSLNRWPITGMIILA